MPNKSDWGRAGEINTIPEYHAIVYKYGSTCFAERFNGEALLSPRANDDTAMIEAAMNGLTSGRTRKETVVLIGDFTINTMVDIPSYTHLKIKGRCLQLANSTLTAMFRNANSGTSTDVQIEIEGGLIDGNEANSATGHCIQLDGVTDSSIHDITVNNAGGASGRNIYITTTNAARVSERITLKNIFTDNATDSNIELAGNTDGSTRLVRGIILDEFHSTNAGARGLILANCRNSTISHGIINTTVTHGVDLSYNSVDNHLSDIDVIDAGDDGFSINTLNSDRNTFVNCRSYSAADQGFTTSAKDLTFIGCLAEESEQAGFRISTGSDRCKLIGCTAKNNGNATADTYHGIFLVASDDCILIGNQCYDDQGTPTQSRGIALDASSDNNYLAWNNVSGNVQTVGISDAGSGNIIRDNRGFVTEAKGTGSIASGATTAVITHGLSFTPVASEINITFTENPTNTAGTIWVDTITSTQFTVNCENDPGASNLDFGWSVRKI